jgi:hypothetical protein
VHYQLGGVGTAELDFTSVKPTGALAVQDRGTQTWTYTPGLITVKLNPPIQLNFGASTDADTAGTFMIMQIVTSTLGQYTNFTPQTYCLKNDIDLSGNTNPPDPSRNFNGLLIDNGADGNIRVPIKYMGIQNDSIHLGVNSFVPVPPWNFPYMEDYPSFQVPDDFNAKTITETGSFSTYLMYKADMQGSVWIALSKIDWTWTERATNNGTAQNPQWTGDGPSKQPAPTGPTMPAGAAAFPTWVNNVRNYGDAVKNPWRLGT